MLYISQKNAPAHTLTTGFVIVEDILRASFDIADYTR